MFVVQMVEFERGWGSKLDEEKGFETEQEAIDFATKYDEEHNNEDEAPDWYMKPFYIGEKPDSYKLKK